MSDKQSSIENGWKGIKPLKTNKIEVSKLLGTPEIDDNDYHGYVTDEAFIRVNYSTCPCQDNQYERGKYNVAKDTVLDYIVYIKKVMKLSEIKFDHKKYLTEKDGHMVNHNHYINEEDGIRISTQNQDGTEYVGQITFFRPRKKDIETFKCKN